MLRILVVVVGISSGCATRTPRPMCGPGWQPLAVERAPERAIDLHTKDATVIEAVEITGVDARFASELRRELRTKPGEALIDAPIGDDVRRLWRLGVIADVQVELDDHTVRFELSPRPTIHSVVRTGGDTLAQARFRQLEATSFEPERVRRMTDALRESYILDGRLDARVDARQRVHPAGVDVCVAIDPGARVTIAKLEFPGRKAISQKTLVAAMPGRESKTNRVGGIYDADALEVAELYLMNEYWERGFAEVTVKNPVVKRRGKRLEVAIPIEEGPIYRLGAVTTNEPGVVDLSRHIKRGDVFSRSKIVDARTKLEEAVAPYKAYVLPVTKVDRTTRTVDINFEVQWRWPWDAQRFWLSRSR